METLRYVMIIILLGAGSRGLGQVTVTMATNCAKGSAMAVLLEQTAADVAKRTDGKVMLKLSYNISQAESQVVSKMRNGLVDGAMLTGEGLKAINSAFQVLELPFLVTTHQEALNVHMAMADALGKLFSDNGFRLACWADPGTSHIISRDPVNDKTSLEGMRMAVLNWDQPGRAYFQKCRSGIVPMGEPEIFPSLQTGSINACYGTPADAVNQQWSAKLIYVMREPFRYRSGAIVFRNGIDSKLTPEQLDALLAAFSALEPNLAQQFTTNNTGATHSMEKAGMEFLNVTPAALAGLKAIATTLWEEKSGSWYPAEMLEKIRGIVKK